MQNITNSFHLGVYGILLNSNSILLIKKSRGPYEGMLDLPGGKPEFGESPEQTLAREFLEETGVSVFKAQSFTNYSTIAHQILLESTINIHHLGMIYMIVSSDTATLKHDIKEQDSLGAVWYPLSSLTKGGLTPFAYQAIMDLKECNP